MTKSQGNDMGRKSTLSPEQWISIERRVLIDGESVNSIAKEFGIDESAIRRKINPNKSESKSLKQLANDKVSAEKNVRIANAEISKLPIYKQDIVFSLAERLNSISSHATSAAEYGMMTSHRLSMLANSEVQKIDDVNPLGSIEQVKGVAILTELANKSAIIGLNLLNANAKNQAPSDNTITLIDAPDAE
ncbi:MAG: hypothetical protein ACYC4K_08685 [Thiobacillus sp.]